MSSLIIESPHRQGGMRRFIQSGITLFFWGVWIYLMLPLIAPLIAAAGLEHSLFVSAVSADHLQLVFPILFFIGVVMLIMELWVVYNIFLHRRRSRRDPLSIVYQNDLASHFGVSSNKLAGWHRSGQMTIWLTEHGGIHDVRMEKPSSVVSLRSDGCEDSRLQKSGMEQAKANETTFHKNARDVFVERGAVCLDGGSA